EWEVTPYLAGRHRAVIEQPLERTPATRRFVDRRDTLRLAVRDRVGGIRRIRRWLAEDPAPVRPPAIRPQPARLARERRQLRRDRMPRLRDLQIRIPDLQHDSPGPELRARHHFLRRRYRQRHPPIARPRAPRTLRAHVVDAASVFQWAAAAQTELPQV